MFLLLSHDKYSPDVRRTQSTMEVSYKILFVISLTINLCILFSVLLPAFLRLLMRRVLSVQLLSLYKESVEENPAFCRRLYLDVMFSGVSLLTGMILLFVSDVLQQPFLSASPSLIIVFSVAVGWQIFKILQNACDPDKTSKHSKITNVLRLVAIFLYASTLVYRQNTILATMGLVVEAHTAFFKMDKLWRILKVPEPSTLYFKSSLVTSLSAVLLRAIFPLVTLIVTSRFHLNEILFMDYLPLAVFFLSLVFYTAANTWFIKVSLEVSHRSYLSKVRIKKNRLLYNVTPTIPNYIHNNLWTGKGRACIVNMNVNPPMDSHFI